jgi:hypothetical protein
VKFTQRHLLIAGVVVVAAIVMFGQRSQRYIGGISPSGPKGAGGADNNSALPRGYRSDAPNSPYTATAQ